MKKIKYILATLSLIFSFSMVFLPTTAGAAGDIYNCANNPDSLICKDKDKSVTGIVKTAINWLLYITGAIAVVMIIYSGILYVMSGGDANNVTKAKNTLMYSIIGLVVASLAWSIVNFALNLF